MSSRAGCPDEDELAAFLSGKLPPAEVRALEQHLAGCAPCRQIVSALASLATPPRSCAGPHDADSKALTDALHRPARELALAPGTKVSRYVIRGQLGEGGMGVVYAAHDPKLDRQVALKLLHRRGLDPAARRLSSERLRREARAMAQLAHPNVVTVYDVGDFDDRMFVAMELVEGATLASWLGAARRSVRDIVSMFLAAGEGLAAAHAAGLVHRDFKPENVLIGRDCRVRVGDFGLARARLARETNRDEPFVTVLSDQSPLTPTRALIGTPYYMAPEQLRREGVDERSDQFSFCVALFAAIAGQHPFEGDDAVARAQAMAERRLRPPPRPDRMPRWMHPILLRGLSADATARHPSMKDLLAALRHDRSRLVAAIAGGALAVIAGSVMLASNPPAAAAPCQDGERYWSGIWDGPRAATVDAAFAATGAPYAHHVATQVQRAFDRYRHGWIAMYHDACAATRVRGEQSGELLDKRVMCLDARLRRARAVIDRIARADADIVERAPRVVAELEGFAACADLQGLSSQVPLPDELTRERVDVLRSELSVLHAERITGKASAAERDQARALLAAVRATKYRPLEAELLLELGLLEASVADFAASKQAFTDAVWAAEAGRDDKLAAHAWIRLMYVDGHQLAHHQDALSLVPRVTALLERLGGDDEMEGRLHIVSALLLHDADRFGDAAAAAERARAAFERRFGQQDLHVADALLRLAHLAEHESPAHVRAYYEQALAIRRTVYGDDHPAIARAIE